MADIDYHIIVCNKIHDNANEMLMRGVIRDSSAQDYLFNRLGPVLLKYYSLTILVIISNNIISTSFSVLRRSSNEFGR